MSKKWYKSSAAKAVQIFLALVLTGVIAAGFCWILAYPALRREVFSGSPAKEYKDTADFAFRMESHSMSVTEAIAAKKLFEADGKYDPEKQVDIEEFYHTGAFSGENAGRFIYRLGDLVEWADRGTDADAEESILVCKKEDGTFYYYRAPEFYRLISNGELHFAAAGGEDGYTDQDILSELTYGYGMPEGVFRGVQDKEGRLVYSDCWEYDGNKYEELYKPSGAEDILAIANEDPQWNGHLDEAYGMLDSVLTTIRDKWTAYESDQDDTEGNTNFLYIYADTKNRKIYTNDKEYASYESLDKNLEALKEKGKFVVIGTGLGDFETNMDISAESWWNEIKYGGIAREDFIFAAAVDTKYPVQDEFYSENQMYQRHGSDAKHFLLWGALAVALLLADILWLTVTAGRNDKDDGLHLNGFDRWKTEPAAAVIILGWFVTIYILAVTLGANNTVNYAVTEISGQFVRIGSYESYLADSIPYIIIWSVLAVYTCGMFLIGYLSLVRRIKAQTVWKNSVLRSICRFAGMVFRNLSSVWKIIVLFGMFVLVQLMYMFDVLVSGYGVSAWTLVLLAADTAAFVCLMYHAVGRQKIKTGIERIAGGEVDYAIPSETLRGEQKTIAEKINSIREGLDAALEENMKSERLKTDLITNVSHDIKTPLTSIINYVELLKQENFEDPKIKRYIEVLEQKSQRLKTLTEDVVEASKVSSGNITLEYMNLNFVEMIQQTSGEFEEKFTVRKLEEVLTLPDEEVLIRADGRRTWRILENIYNNAAKYAMEGTRVYGDLKADETKVSFALKNISEQPLNISADELTERFIRGDISRSTEGSGLGLSIAETLTQMQGGEFKLYLDGDLFKVTVTFPRVR